MKKIRRFNEKVAVSDGAKHILTKFSEYINKQLNFDIDDTQIISIEPSSLGEEYFGVFTTTYVKTKLKNAKVLFGYKNITNLEISTVGRTSQLQFGFISNDEQVSIKPTVYQLHYHLKPVDIKATRILHRLKDEMGLSTQDVELYANRLKSNEFVDKIELLPQENIGDVFDKRKCSDKYTIGQSCNYGFGIEHDLIVPTDVLVIKEDGLIVARAFLWEVTRGTDCKFMIDRVYMSDEKYESAFRAYAQIKGYLYRTPEVHSYSIIDYRNNTKIVTELVFKLKNLRKGEFPILDSFISADLHRELISTHASFNYSIDVIEGLSSEVIQLVIDKDIVRIYDSSYFTDADGTLYTIDDIEDFDDVTKGFLSNTIYKGVVALFNATSILEMGDIENILEGDYDEYDYDEEAVAFVLNTGTPPNDKCSVYKKNDVYFYYFSF